MADDAKFEDGAEAALKLLAQDIDDLKIISALVQDAIFSVQEMKWNATKRSFAILANRFRWEDKDTAEAQNRAFERVQSVLTVNSVEKVATNGLSRADKDQVLSLLTIEFLPKDDGTGILDLTLAGDGVIRLHVECVDVNLSDMTRPYAAQSGQAPQHDLS